MKSSISYRALNEHEVIDAVAAFLKMSGYTITGNLRIRTWRPDIVAVRGDVVIIAEAKGPYSNLRKALAQVALYGTDATSAYLAVPAGRVTVAIKDAARVLGVGLIAVDDRVKVIVRPSVGTARPVLLQRVKKEVGTLSRSKKQKNPRRSLPLHRILKHRSVLDVLLSNPMRSFTIRELSITARAPYSSTWRVVEDLKALGAVISERIGPSEHLSLNKNSPLMNDLVKLHSLDLEPHRAAARCFTDLVAGVPEVRKVVLFGSVARRLETTRSDIDVALFLSRKGKDALNHIFRAVADIQDRTRLKVNPLVITESELRSRSQISRDIAAGEVLFERH